jgi:hypothetical protein
MLGGYLLSRLILDQIYQGQRLRELVVDPIDGLEQVGVVDLLPFVARKQATSCRRGRRRCWSGRRRSQRGRNRCR